ncbi:MAG TPA: hypothetical protein VMF65_05695 [Acidimicrobiales bacterium]|nr:hypothetical protein [Acidimicrobiales bacterium]
MTVDPRSGEVETALAVRAREVRDAVAAQTASEGQQVADLLGTGRLVRAALEPGPFQGCAASEPGLVEH